MPLKNVFIYENRNVHLFENIKTFIGHPPLCICVITSCKQSCNITSVLTLMYAIKLIISFLFKNNTNEAITLLENLGELKYKLGIVSTLVTLYLNVNNFKAASDLFNDTLSWYSQKEVRLIFI